MIEVTSRPSTAQAACAATSPAWSVLAMNWSCRHPFPGVRKTVLTSPVQGLPGPRAEAEAMSKGSAQEILVAMTVARISEIHGARLTGNVLISPRVPRRAHSSSAA